MNYVRKTPRYYIRKALGSILKNNPLLLSLYNEFFRLRNTREFYQNIEDRSVLPLFNYVELSNTIPFCPLESTKDSNYYGYLHILKKYGNVQNTYWSIEHGLMYGDYIPYEYSCKTIKKLLTFNCNRAYFLKEALNKDVKAIGPYIHYAQSLLNDYDIASYKDIFGKILLFFPSHSSVECVAQNNIKVEIDKIMQIKNRYEFDTVLVCMYYLDIQRFKYYRLYEQAGFRVVTAGHQLDINFLRRLKSIILIADFTISSAVGTQLGYCIYLNKPHFIIGELQNKNMPSDYNEIYHTFSHFSPEITVNQINVASKYWGFNSILTENQLKDILVEE